MANKKKRIERELTLVRDRELLKSQLKKEKQQRKDGLKSFLEIYLKAKKPNDFRNEARKNQLLFLFRKARYLKSRNKKGYQTFLKMLSFPKPIFSQVYFYEKMASSFVIQTPCRSLESWKMPKSKNDNVLFKSLFCHLLVAYKIPNAVDDIIDRFIRFYLTMECKEVEIMFHMIKGKGIHKFPRLQLEMNSKMNFLLNHAPLHFNLPRTMWWAKIKSMGVSNSIAAKLVDNFYIQIETEWNEWYDDLIFFLNRFSDISKSDLKKILDFIIAQKKNGINIHLNNCEEEAWVPALFPEFKFKGRTVVSVLKYVEKWRAYVQLAKDAGVGGEFKVSPIQSMRIKQGKRLIRIRQITNLKSLALEGNKMNHCVATYAGECLSGTSSIWSMNEILAVGKMKRLITIEVEEKTKKVLQASGNSNRDLYEIEKKWLKKWVEKEELECENVYDD
ncbi:MAG: PcfJ domain-containing protein [Saprospiraceae bacterium]